MKISFSLRIFTLFFIVLAAIAWLFVNQALGQIKVGLRQSAETTLVDMAQILAAEVELDVAADGRLNTQPFADRFQQALDKQFNAEIYRFAKERVNVAVYITDAQGIVRYDSQGKYLGQDFSRWHDVHRALRGEYGARSSFIDAAHTEKNDPKHMIVAAPIRYQGEIIGVLSVAQPVGQFDFFSLSGERELRIFVLSAIAVALLVVLLMSVWLTRALSSLSAYAKAMADKKSAHKPVFYDPHLSKLGDAIEYLRAQLDGKEYVEQYVHALAHELKTPLTGIRAATEFLQEADLSAEERQQFTARVAASSARMQDLVGRMLVLAKLENRQALNASQTVRMDELFHAILQEYAPLLAAKEITLSDAVFPACSVQGDELLLRQALANLLDNALAFCPQGGVLRPSIVLEPSQLVLDLYNSGEAIPEYALTKIFERFFSLPRPDGTGRSSGLGLSFVRQIMLLHHGEIHISNQEGGVRARLVLPQG